MICIIKPKVKMHIFYPGSFYSCIALVRFVEIARQAGASLSVRQLLEQAQPHAEGK